MFSGLSIVTLTMCLHSFTLLLIDDRLKSVLFSSHISFLFFLFGFLVVGGAHQLTQELLLAFALKAGSF